MSSSLFLFRYKLCISKIFILYVMRNNNDLAAKGVKFEAMSLGEGVSSTPRRPIYLILRISTITCAPNIEAQLLLAPLIYIFSFF
jgi:hypothetical protein